MLKLIQQSLKGVKSGQLNAKTTYKPLFYRIFKENERDVFLELLKTPGLQITDYLFDQVKELMKLRNPSVKLSEQELQNAAYKHLEPHDLEEYGVWVYYPWSNRLVHIVDEEEFIEIRTSRNKYKITPGEQETLGQKKIGVIGLSVGQSVSLTMAMERIGGEFRLADFDVLELTNLNRIRTGIHNLGLPKVHVVAREIAEIDPFIKVSCFEEGLNESNMDTFFTEGGKLDLLVEESDGFDIKILSRYKARELKIPVIMEASDRCTVDVERFDLEPERSILHGLVNHLDVKILKNLKTTEDKIPYLLDMVGLTTASARLKASMLEIDQSITTWPQLASSVTMGGGITADVSRRILLNSYTESGRYHVDIEELIGDKKNTPQQAVQKIFGGTKKSLTTNEMEMFVDRVIKHAPNDSISLTKEELQTIVNAATKAPSGGNAQPWKWIYQNNTLFLFHDVEKSDSLLDFDGLASYIGLGAATENLVLKSHELGLEVNVQTFPLPEELRLVAVFNFSKTYSPEKNIRFESHEHDHLVKSIDVRLTNRTISERKEIDRSLFSQLMDITKTVEGASLKIIDDTKKIIDLGDIVAKVERIRLMHERGHYDFVNEVCWTKEEAESRREGVDLATVHLTEAEKAGFLVAKDWNVIQYLNQWGGGSAFEKLAKKTIASASAIGIITMPEYSPENYFNGGRALERVWLAANAMNLSFQPQSPATFFFARLVHGNGIELNDTVKKELHQLRNEFLQLADIKNQTEVFVFRLCIADNPTVKSLRKELNDVLFLKN